MRRPHGNDLALGTGPDGDSSLTLTREQRATHVYMTGATGTGKSKLLEHFIRQDIRQWHKSRSGMLVIDPHGSLYNSLMAWLAWHAEVLSDIPIIPIDLRSDESVIAYNLLRRRHTADPSVVISNFVQSMAYVWGESGTARTPRFSRWATNILRVLYEKGLTLADVELLTSRVDKRRRQSVVRGVEHRSAVEDFDFLDQLNPFQIEGEIGSTISRFYKFLSTETMRNMFGQSDVSLDFGKALSEGHIILVNLSTEGGRIDNEDASVFATLLLSDLWTSAQERGKGIDAEDVKPFYVYLDEFQNFITPTIAKNLDQARGFGLHLTLANQFPNQILHAGAHGPQVLDSVMVNARNKFVFQVSGEENLRPLALDLFMGTMSPDKIKHELYSTKVMGYTESYRTAYARGSTRGSASGTHSGTSQGTGMGGTSQFEYLGMNPHSMSESESSFSADSYSNTEMDSQSESESQTEVPVLLPVMGKELSSVQFEPVEDQTFRAMAVLHDQKQRHFVARLAGATVPFAVRTPDVKKPVFGVSEAREHAEKLLKKWAFAIPSPQARQHVKDRAAKLRMDADSGESLDEPTTSRRKIR